MESLMLAVSVVSPLLIYMLAGNLIRRKGWFSREQFQSLNGVIFKVFLPLKLFFDVYEADLGAAVQIEVFAFAVLAVLAVYLVTWFAVARSVKKKADAATLIQGIYRSNFVLFGNSIAFSMCDDAGIALVAAMAAVIVPLYNILSVILFESMRGEKAKLSEIVINILRNPLVEAGVLGICCNLLGLKLPEWLMAPFVHMGEIATPLALVTLGGMLSFGSIVKHKKYLMAAVAGRLAVVPAAVMSAAVCLGFSGQTLVVFLSIFAAPTAVASAPMAQSMGGNGALAGEIVVLTSAFSIITIFLLVFGLSGMGLI